MKNVSLQSECIDEVGVNVQPCESVIRRIRRFLEPVTSTIRNLRLLRVELWRVEGEERGTSLPLVVIAGLKRQNKHYLFGSMFAAGYRERFLGRVWLWNLKRGVVPGCIECDILVTELRRKDRKSIRGAGFWIPGSVKGEVDLPLDLSAPGGSSVKSDLRRIRKNGLTYEVTRDLAAFDDFYYNMYVPHLESAHADGAFITRYEVMLDEFKMSELLQVKFEDRVIGGLLLVDEPERPRLGSLGVLNGDHEYLKVGVISALFHYSFEWLGEKGAVRVNTGASRAFLNDGVLRYKKKFQQRIIGVSPNGLLFKILSVSPGAEAFLRANPFISESEAGLQANVFIGKDEDCNTEFIKEAEKNYFHPGLESLQFHQLKEMR